MDIQALLLLRRSLRPLDWVLFAAFGTSTWYFLSYRSSFDGSRDPTSLIIALGAGAWLGLRLLYIYRELGAESPSPAPAPSVSQPPARFGAGGGIGNFLLDAFLVYMAVYSFFQLSNPRSNPGASLIIVLACAAVFVWRRGWIQRWRYEQAQQVVAARVETIRQTAEAKQQTVPQGDPAPAPSPEELELPIYTVNLPRVEKFSATQAAGFMRALLSAAGEGQLRLALVGTRDEVRWQITHLASDEQELTPEALTTLVATYYPGAVVERTPLVAAQSLYRRYHLFKPKTVRYFDRALEVETIRSDDPLGRLATALTQLEAGETLTFTIAVFGVTVADEQELERVLTVSAFDAGYRTQVPGVAYRQKWDEAILGGATAMGVAWLKNQGLKKQRVQAFTDAETKRFLEKLTQPLAQCAMAVMFDTPTVERLNNLSFSFGAVEQLSGEELKIQQGYTSRDIAIADMWAWFTRVPSQYLVDLSPDNPNDPDLSAEYLFNWTISELAAVWHLPHEGFEKSLLGIKGAQVAVPRTLTEVKDGVFLGNNRLGARTAEVYLPQGDRTAHTAIIGKPGRGKSSLMHHMLHQDIAAGRGVCLIDPKGTLVSRVLQHSIPPGREDDVLVLDIATAIDGVFYPPPMNVFLSGSLTADMAARRLLTVFDTIFDGFADKKMADTLNMALMTVYLKERPSLLDIHCLFNDASYREQLVSRVTNPVVRDFWAQFEAAKDKQQASDAAPVLWRLRSFYNNERLQTITCHPNRLNLAKLISENKIILVSLGDPMDVMPEKERYVLGAALVAQIEMAARSGAVTGSPYLLYIDEVQEFINTSLPKMLSQLREYGLGMVIANQYFAQLFGDTFHALEGTVSTLIAFEVGKSDANALAPYMQPGFAANDLVALGKYKAAASMLDAEGSRQSAFSLETVPPPGHGTTAKAREMALRRKSVENFGLTPYDEVLAWVRQQYDCSTPFSSRPATGDGDRPTRDADDFWE